MIHTYTQAYQPTITAHTNGRSGHLIRVTIEERGADASITLDREAWQALISAVQHELNTDAEELAS